MNDGLNKHFSLIQEKVLTSWMDLLIQSGFPPRLDFLRNRANTLLNVQRDDQAAGPTTVGKNWPSNFIARHP